MADCALTRHQVTQQPNGKWFEYFILNGQVVENEISGPNAYTRTPPAQVMADLGYCQQTGQREATETAPTLTRVNLNATATPDSSMGIPVPLMAGVLVGLVYAGLNAMKTRAERQYWQNLTRENDGLLWPDLEITEPSPFVGDTPSIGATDRPVIEDDWADSIPDMERVYPHSQRPGRGTGEDVPETTGTPAAHQHTSTSTPAPYTSPPTRHSQHPLSACPLPFGEPISQQETDALTYCAYQGYSQNKAIESIWGIPKGSSDSYHKARNRWQTFLTEWERLKQHYQHQWEGQTYGR